MSNSFFYLQADKNDANSKFLRALEKHAQSKKQQVYVIDRPLSDPKYSYGYNSKLIILSPGYKIVLVDFGHDANGFSEFVDDFIEDLASISDKYRYKEILGRSRHWNKELVTELHDGDLNHNIGDLFLAQRIVDPPAVKKSELLISLLIGSINDIEKVKADVPNNVLDKVKQKIILFDGDQTRFIYQKPDKKQITIQGLSGTGKTELLLHKLKDLYTEGGNSRIIFTCHNKVLADSLRNRIPDFFNFMKVEEQIRWEKRLWCVHAWGSQSNKNSGAYSYICDFYNIPFYRYSGATSFDTACKAALKSLVGIDIGEYGYAFDHMLVDESQDFPKSFFELCGRVTKNAVYIAGDIFQSIFDSAIIRQIKPDYLLSKCYRTDPRTLMFAHAVGMGLWETPPLRWLEDREWKACGYIVEKKDSGREYLLTREPLRRFEDLEEEGIDSVEIVQTRQDQDEDTENKIVEIIKSIKQRYSTALPDDIGVIFIDNTKNTYLSGDRLEQSIPREVGWRVNKAYETKETQKGKLFVSNRNNVKGLEFPFVICVTKKLNRSRDYRNALYMMLTRSFLKTYLLTSLDSNLGLIGKLETGLSMINHNGALRVFSPSEEEKEQISTSIEYKESSASFYDFVYSIFDDLKIPQDSRVKLYEVVKSIIHDDFDYDNAREVIEFCYGKMRK